MTRLGASRWLYVFAVVALAMVAWVVLDGEQHLLSTAPAPVSVDVQAVLMPRDDVGGTPNYLYIVMLPDGTLAHYSSEQVYKARDRIVVLYSRGRLTGRVRLTTPPADADKANDRR